MMAQLPLSAANVRENLVSVWMPTAHWMNSAPLSVYWQPATVCLLKF